MTPRKPPTDVTFTPAKDFRRNARRAIQQLLRAEEYGREEQSRALVREARAARELVIKMVNHEPGDHPAPWRELKDRQERMMQIITFLQERKSP